MIRPRDRRRPAAGERARAEGISGAADAPSVARAVAEADRLRGSELADVRRRQRALLDAIDGRPVPHEPADASVILLAPGSDPMVASWPGLLVLLRAALGVELHGDTIARVDRLMSEGRRVALTLIDGWIDAVPLTIAIGAAGGDA
ncbi:MAG TPA: hypothetical protein VGH28_23455 [Polyangiaceae bacterium]|jgi:hypothetical protein